MTIDLQEIAVSETTMTSSLGTAHTPGELVALLQAHRIQDVQLTILPGASYETIGKLIFQLLRSVIEVKISGQTVQGGESIS